MKPKITDMEAWRQAELLMQPALIRLLDNIRKRLENSPWKGTYHDIQTPIPGYRLDLELHNQVISIDVWDLCYQICFKNYTPTHIETQTVEVEIDTNLFDKMGEVDWAKLDEKTSQIVDKVFTSLPSFK